MTTQTNPDDSFPSPALETASEQDLTRGNDDIDIISVSLQDAEQGNSKTDSSSGETPTDDGNEAQKAAGNDVLDTAKTMAEIKDAISKGGDLSSFDKMAVHAARQEIRADQMAEQAKELAVKTFTDEQKAKLEELNTNGTNEEYNEALAKFQEENRQAYDKKQAEATEERVKEQNKAALQAYSEANPDKPLSRNIINERVAPNILKQLISARDSGQITYGEFLQACSDEAYREFKIGVAEKPVQSPDLGKMGGGASNSASATPNQSYMTANY